MSSHAAQYALVDPPDGAALPAPVLHAALLARIRELNFDYLELLAVERRTPRLHAQYFPPATAAALDALSTDARRRLANAPYTLFRLDLDRACLWTAACNVPALSVHEHYAASANVCAGFCETALSYAWHTACTARVALRLTYGLRDETARRLIAAPLWRLRRIAHDHPEVLAPRWPTNPAFWPQLARLAAGEDARLRIALLLGHQLIAGELGEAGASERRGRAVRAARLGDGGS